ncbi:MAG TPA: hypothetical protein VGH64_16050 [Puia sp.]|jgi:hypothetical protein
MKTVLLFCFAALIIFAGCKKDSKPPVDPAYQYRPYLAIIAESDTIYSITVNGKLQVPNKDTIIASLNLRQDSFPLAPGQSTLLKPDISDSVAAIVIQMGGKPGDNLNLYNAWRTLYTYHITTDYRTFNTKLSLGFGVVYPYISLTN